MIRYDKMNGHDAEKLKLKKKLHRNSIRYKRGNRISP